MKYSIDKKPFYSVISLEEETLNAHLAPSLKSDFIFHKQEGVPNLVLDLSGVFTGPAATRLLRMPCGPSSRAR